jgi:hypothetical protein
MWASQVTLFAERLKRQESHCNIGKQIQPITNTFSRKIVTSPQVKKTRTIRHAQFVLILLGNWSNHLYQLIGFIQRSKFLLSL